MASAFSPSTHVLLLEQQETIPTNKYWLTDAASARANPDLASCVDRRYKSLDFVAYDGTTASISGDYHLWHAIKLIDRLLTKARERGTSILTGQRLYSVSYGRDRLLVRANSEEFQTKLLIDCMGFGSPLVTAKGIVDIAGYYIIHGSEVATKVEPPPIGLANVILDRRPTFFELFPTSTGSAHAAVILPSTHYRPTRSLKSDWNFIVARSHYSRYVDRIPSHESQAYFGIIPVGRLRTPALDRIVFFGEAGQANPAASATGLTRMLRTFRDLVDVVELAIKRDRLDRRSLIRCLPELMSPANRLFQECLFERILTLTSDDFRRLVQELDRCPDDVVSDLIFASFDFLGRRAVTLAALIADQPGGLLGRTLIQTILRRLVRRSA